MGLFRNHNLKNTILADGKTLTLDTRKSRLNNNVMLVAASGRGKTRQVIKPNIMQMNSNYVISDPKGTLILELGTMLKNNGYKIKVLNLIDLEHSNKYNPFYYLKSHADVYKMIDFLMANINQGNTNSNDPFWNNAAKMLLAAICFYIVSECNLEDQSFASVLKLLSCYEVQNDEISYMVDSTLDIMFKDLKERDPDHIAVTQYKMFKSCAQSSRTAASIVITAMVYLQNFNLPEYKALTSSDNLELEKLSTEKTALFVITSDTDRSKNWLAGIFYSQLFDMLCYQENKLHIRFILDDFVCTGKIPDFDYKMAMIRSRNISCMVVIQDEAQLKKEYGDAAQGIISNCESYIFLGSPNIDICDAVAHRLGDRKLSGSDLRKLEHNKCVVICGNKGGIFGKFDIKRHPRYSEIADSDHSPLFYDLQKEHRIVLDCLGTEEPKQLDSNSEIGLKDGLFDSHEEKYLFDIITDISNLNVKAHEQLRDIFVSNVSAYSKKFSYMHCDFVFRDEDMKIMFGLEIDGNQHYIDDKQFANDRLKDSFFSSNDIPLLRFSAKTVRENPLQIVEEVIKTASEIDGKEHIFTGTIPPYTLPQKVLTDTREVERQHCVHSRSLQERPAQNHELLKPRYLEKDMPVTPLSTNKNELQAKTDSAP